MHSALLWLTPATCTRPHSPRAPPRQAGAQPPPPPASCGPQENAAPLDGPRGRGHAGEALLLHFLTAPPPELARALHRRHRRPVAIRKAAPPPQALHPPLPAAPAFAEPAAAANSALLARLARLHERRLAAHGPRLYRHADGALRPERPQRNPLAVAARKAWAPVVEHCWTLADGTTRGTGRGMRTATGGCRVSRTAHMRR